MIVIVNLRRGGEWNIANSMDESVLRSINSQLDGSTKQLKPIEGGKVEHCQDKWFGKGQPEAWTRRT